MVKIVINTELKSKHTCEIGVMRGVDEVVWKREGHVFTLVQFLRWYYSILITNQIPG